MTDHEVVVASEILRPAPRMVSPTREGAVYQLAMVTGATEMQAAAALDAFGSVPQSMAWLMHRRATSQSFTPDDGVYTYGGSR